ncbi:MAG: MFS transporter [Gammaproteobacteria bacterium]
MLNRNLIILLLCQCFTTAGTVLVISVGGIIGATLAPSPWLATLPPSIMVLGSALAVLPASWFIQRTGRHPGLALAAFAGTVGPLAAVGALLAEQFWLFCVAAGIVGAQIAFAQQYRYAAAESVSEAQGPQAISLVLVGSLGGASIGPALAAMAETPVFGVPWISGFLGSAVLSVLSGVLLLGLRGLGQVVAADRTASQGALTRLLQSPVFLVAVLAGVVAQGMMAFVMTATPVSMHVVDGHGMPDTSSVIRAHVLAMYIPSLASAALIGYLGLPRMMWIGIAALGATVFVGLQGHAVLYYWWALVLLGVGWNFLFVGGTSLLVLSYQPEDRFRAQALNDFVVFGCSAVASLLAGSVVIQFGWAPVMWGTVPFVAVMAVALAWMRWTQPALGAPVPH